MIDEQMSQKRDDQMSDECTRTFLIRMIKLFCRSTSSINAGDLKVLYPQLDIDPMKEIRPVDTKMLNVWQKTGDPPTMLTFRLPEGNQFKANVKRLTINLNSWSWVSGHGLLDFTSNLEVMLEYFLSL